MWTDVARARRASPASMAAAVYLFVTALLFRDLLPDIATHLYSDLGDPLLNASVLEWSARHLPLSAAWWNFPAFAPLSGVTAFTEHLLLAYPVSAPIVWLTGNAVLAHNVLLLAAFPLNGLAAYLLAHEVTRSASAAFLGGLAFAFAPYHSTHLSHVQTLLAFGMPLALVGLHRYLAGIRDPGPGTRRDATNDRIPDPGSRIPFVPRPAPLALFGGGWLITALSNSYMLVFFPLLAVSWCAWFVRPREWRRLLPPMATAAVVTLPVIPLLWGYHVRQAAYGLTRTITEIRMFSADMVGLARLSHRESLWRGILPTSFEESALFPGFAILMLSVVAVWMCRGLRGSGPHQHSAGQWRGRFPLRQGFGETSPERGARRRVHSASRALFGLAAVLTLVVLARVWTGASGWHLGPIPLPPFAPFRVVTVAVLAFVMGILFTDRYRDGWSRRDPVMFYATAAVVFWLLALGPQPEWSESLRALTYGPYWLLIQFHALNSLRVPARAWLPAVLCLSVLAAAGASCVASRVSRKRGILIAAIAIAIVAEGWFVDRHVPAPAPMPAGVIPAGAIVLDLPVEQGVLNTIPQYRAVRGGYRAINGYSGYEPGHFQPAERAIAGLDRDALTSFRILADLYVIVRPETIEAVGRWVAGHSGAERVHAGPGLQVFKLPRLHPEAPRRPLPLPLPGPGSRPFGVDGG
jgi:hypothetical protein